MKKIINYSGIPALILMAALVFMPISCSKEAVKDNPEADNSSQLIKVSGEDVSVATKTTLEGLATKWVASNDQVGIYSPLARTTLGGGTAIANVEFHAASSGVSSNFTGTMYWGAANTPHIFYAYYPYSIGYSGASNVVPITLSDNQIQLEANSNAHIGALDFMIATPKTVTSPPSTAQIANTEVALHYNHVFTVLEFQIKGGGQLKAIKLSANSTLAFSGGTIDITQATPDAAYTIASQTGTSNEAVVTLTTPANLTATNTETKVYMVINPGTPTGNCLVELSVDGTTWKYMLKAVPVGGFKRGIKYVVSVDASSASTLGAGEVASLTGKVWLDRNLGATQVATSSTDANAYGYLYQWGRGTDGHQIRTSSTTPTLSILDVPGNANFILAPYTPFDWRSGQNVNLWQGVTGTNNPCPSGFRLPTDFELYAERASWSSQNSAGAYASPLKFTVAGTRYYFGSLLDVGSNGYYWSSTIGGTSSYSLNFGSSDADVGSHYGRAVGCSVRCIKN